MAPMAGFTDSAFRQMCKRFGADVVYSEMASVAALSFQPQKTLALLDFADNERPYVVQLFGSEPKQFEKATKIIEREIKPDGIDINFGCPVNKVLKQGAGAILMDKPKLAKEIIKAVLSATDLPVSIKVRTKAEQTDVLKFLNTIAGLNVKAVMIHGRSLKQLFAGSVDLAIIRAAKEYFIGKILANGFYLPDLKEEKNKRLVYHYYQNLLAKTAADGVGIARAALGRPWIFKAIRTGQSVFRSRRAVFKEIEKHAELTYKLKGKQGIIEMRKHLCWYVQAMPGAKELRQKFVKVETVAEIKEILAKAAI